MSSIQGDYRVTVSRGKQKTRIQLTESITHKPLLSLDIASNQTHFPIVQKQSSSNTLEITFPSLFSLTVTPLGTNGFHFRWTHRNIECILNGNKIRTIFNLRTSEPNLHSVKIMGLEGDWEKGKEMVLTPEGLWRTETTLTQFCEYKYKMYKSKDDKIGTWESCGNRRQSKILGHILNDTWNFPLETSVEENTGLICDDFFLPESVKCMGREELMNRKGVVKDSLLDDLNFLKGLSAIGLSKEIFFLSNGVSISCFNGRKAQCSSDSFFRLEPANIKRNSSLNVLLEYDVFVHPSVTDSIKFRLKDFISKNHFNTEGREE